MGNEDGNIFWLHFKTLIYFVLFLIILPFLTITFAVVTLYHKLKLFILSKRYHYLDFARSNSVRTLMDTSRNPGILHFLVKAKGKCDIDEIREAYQKHLLDKRDRNGKFLFPRLRTVLISSWGQYAFIKKFDDFNIENHIEMGSTSWQGQPINESNIQKCVSSAVSKYMASNYSPWQIKVFPFGDNSTYYLLIRIHHLILDEQKNLNIGDMMLLNRTRGILIVNDSIDEVNTFVKKTPLENIVKKPRSILKIYEDFTEYISCRWNEFVFKHDSLDHFDREGCSKEPDSLSKLFTSLVMANVHAHLDYQHQAAKVLRNSSDPLKHFKIFNELLQLELESRHISSKVILMLILNALHPVTFIVNVTKFFLQTISLWILLSPFYVLREFNSIRKIVFTREEIDTSSFSGFIYTYLPLCIGSLVEVLYFMKIIYTAPRMLIEEIFSRDSNTYYLSTSLCGRKNVTWSETIEVSDLHAKAVRNRQSYAEVMLATISSCLLGFFNELKKEERTRKVPTSIKLNYRSVSFSYLFGIKRPTRRGVIGMRLPLLESPAAQYKQIRQEIEKARRQQIIIYIISLIQIRFDILTLIIPSVYLKILINFISKKFSLSITEVLGIDELEPNEYLTLYNAKIEDVIFFRTPQANNSTSITIQRFRNRFRINVMCDSNIEHQQLISNGFKNAFHKLPVRKY